MVLEIVDILCHGKAVAHDRNGVDGRNNDAYQHRPVRPAVRLVEGPMGVSSSAIAVAALSAPSASFCGAAAGALAWGVTSSSITSVVEGAEASADVAAAAGAAAGAVGAAVGVVAAGVVVGVVGVTAGTVGATGSVGFVGVTGVSGFDGTTGVSGSSGAGGVTGSASR